MGLAAKIVVGAGAVAVLAGAVCWLSFDRYYEHRAGDAVLELRAERGDASASDVAERVRPFIVRAAWGKLAGIMTIVCGLGAIFVAVRWPGAPARREAASAGGAPPGGGTP